MVTLIINGQLPNLNEYTRACRSKWYEPNKKRDLDNICFAKKFILDALVGCGTIKADGWQGVSGFTDDFFIDKDYPRIEVDIKQIKGC